MNGSAIRELFARALYDCDMAHYAWATDIHLDFLVNQPNKLLGFMESLVKTNPTGIFLTGDLSIAKDVVYHLSALERVVQRPIYFVLGNHDYYGSSIQEIRKTMRELNSISPFLRYMPLMPYYALSSKTAVVGHDGWYDAFYGADSHSRLQMRDWQAIHEFREVNGNIATIVSVARKLAFDGVQHVHDGIKRAVRYHKNIIVLTHYPPFREAYVSAGNAENDDACPWFTSKMMGDMLLDASRSFPQHTFTVLCGHTHAKFSGKIKDNLTVHVGGAEYYQPALQNLIEVV